MFDYNRLSGSTLPSARAQGKREGETPRHRARPHSSWHKQPQGPGSVQGERATTLLAKEPSALTNALACPLLTDALLRFFFSPLKNLSRVWVTDTFSPLGPGSWFVQDCGKPVFQVPLATPVPCLPRRIVRIAFPKDPEETRLLGENQHLPLCFCAATFNVGCCFKAKRLIGRKGCTGS